MSVVNRQRRTIPIVPTTILKAHHALEPSDGRFKAACRLMQSLYRERQGFPCGRLHSESGSARKLGSRITPKVAATGANFISPDIAALAVEELAYREIAAVFDSKRLFENLLSSQALTINLFGPLKRDIQAATLTFQRLFPTFVAAVDDIWFEHSPGRGDRSFTGDHTAFDALVLCRTPEGRKGFIALEVKYTEVMSGTPIAAGSAFDSLASRSGIYSDPASHILRTRSLQQLWREHLLAYSMLETGLYETGRFAIVAPAGNRACALAINGYRQMLNPTPLLPFDFLSVETIVEAMATAGARRSACAVAERYLDFSAVERAFFTTVSGGQKSDRLAAA